MEILEMEDYGLLWSHILQNITFMPINTDI
jgi:hypothetical protein